MTMMKMPVFTWTSLCTNVLIVASFPVLTVGSFYERWIGPIVILGVLVFCGIMGLAGWELITTALRH